MTYRDFIGSLFIFFGGILAIIPVLPLKIDDLPIYTYTLHQPASYPEKAYVSFWGTIIISQDQLINGIHLNSPSNWTPLNIPPAYIILFFATIGFIGIILSIDSILNFLPTRKVKHIPITTLLGIFIGLMAMILTVFIFLGSAFPFSGGAGLRRPTNLQPIIIFNVYIGLGYWLLVLSGLLLFSGSLVNEITSNKFFPKRSSKNLQKTGESSLQINQFLNEIDDIIQESTSQEKNA